MDSSFSNTRKNFSNHLHDGNTDFITKQWIQHSFPRDHVVIAEREGTVLPGTGGDGNMKTLATGLLVAMASVATAGLALKVGGVGNEHV